jgi:hypothetical protein
MQIVVVTATMRFMAQPGLIYCRTVVPSLGVESDLCIVTPFKLARFLTSKYNDGDIYRCLSDTLTT